MKDQILQILNKFSESQQSADLALEEIINLLKNYKDKESINDVITICDFNSKSVNVEGLIKESFLVINKQDLE